MILHASRNIPALYAYPKQGTSTINNSATNAIIASFDHEGGGVGRAAWGVKGAVSEDNKFY